MRNPVIADATTWLEENASVSASWSEDLAQGGAALDRTLFGLMDVDADGVVDKVNENKLAHDVEDLSAIFEQLEEGAVDFSLPCDEDDDVDVDQEQDWIETLDQDVVNVEELSAAFDLLAEQVEAAGDDAGSEASSQVNNESEADSDDDDEDAESVRIVPAAPKWAAAAPLDPRSVIRSTIFKGLDPRIPSVSIPRMDLGFGENAGATSPQGPLRAGIVPPNVTARLSPKACTPTKKDIDEYVHDPATCWICKSDKTAFKKFALHRYLEKRRRRNWKRGPRYRGRSHVATNRVRQGGRFVCTARWI